jgi:hypothetical protein
VAFCAKARAKKVKFWQDEPKTETETEYRRRTAMFTPKELVNMAV